MPDLDVELTALVYGGDALGRLPDGRAVFVPFGLPGERVRVQLVEEKSHHARAELVEVLQPSPERIQPRCPHFGECGGCHYQHMTYTRQLQVKSQMLRDQLERIAGLDDPPLDTIVSSPSAWNYRNSIQFSLDGEGRLGFQRAGSHQVVVVRECHLPEEGLNALWPTLDIGSGSGIERLELRQDTQGDIMLLMHGDQSPEMVLELPISVVHQNSTGQVVLAGDDHLVMDIDNRLFKVSAGSFFQVNTPQSAAMVRHVQVLLASQPIHCLADVYCGVGLFSAFLARKTDQCFGIEQSPSSCQDYVDNLDEFDNISLYEGPAEVVLPALDVKPDTILVDPPRAGLARLALDALVRMAPERMVYVSCDPATLARDARRLAAAGYRLESITPFDLFPQTFHIESISLFLRSLD